MMQKQFPEKLINDLIGKEITIAFTGDYGAKEPKDSYELTRKVKGPAWGFDAMIELRDEPTDGENFMFFRGATQIFLSDIKKVECEGDIIFDADK